MNKAGNYITEEKRKAIEAELADLRGPKRKEILDALGYAKSLGDLSENAEYHQAREDQGKLEVRIKTLEEILESSQIVKGGGGDTVEIGSRVKVQKTDTKEERQYVIVGSQESDMSQGKISNHSPIGSALFGKRKGDEVSVAAPNGTIKFKIIEVA